jgi:anti-sigma28 factor (negative regulator of flagellin synthesis)
MRLQLDSMTTGAADTAATAQAQNGQGTRTAGQGTTASSKDSSYVSGISSILNNSATVRSDRLQQLASLVQNGTYQVSASDISRSIVQDSLAGGA